MDLSKLKIVENELKIERENLLSAVKNLQDYKGALCNNWTGTETVYVKQAVENTISLINSIIGEIKRVEQEVTTLSANIKKEKQLAAKYVADLSAARTRLDEARSEYESFKKQYDDFMTAYGRVSAVVRHRYIDKFEEMQHKIKAYAEQIDEAEKELTKIKKAGK